VADDQWFVRRAGKQKGPFSTASLKQFAEQGRLMPEDELRKAEGSRWVTASAVRGLFAKTNATEPQPPRDLPYLPPTLTTANGVASNRAMTSGTQNSLPPPPQVVVQQELLHRAPSGTSAATATVPEEAIEAKSHVDWSSAFLLAIAFALGAPIPFAFLVVLLVFAPPALLLLPIAAAVCLFQYRSGLGSFLKTVFTPRRWRLSTPVAAAGIATGFYFAMFLVVMSSRSLDRPSEGRQNPAAAAQSNNQGSQRNRGDKRRIGRIVVTCPKDGQEVKAVTKNGVDPCTTCTNCGAEYAYVDPDRYVTDEFVFYECSKCNIKFSVNGGLWNHTCGTSVSLENPRFVKLVPGEKPSPPSQPSPNPSPSAQPVPKAIVESASRDKLEALLIKLAKVFADKAVAAVEQSYREHNDEAIRLFKPNQIKQPPANLGEKARQELLATLTKAAAGMDDRTKDTTLAKVVDPLISEWIMKFIFANNPGPVY
jgi:hypothetical protein